MKLSKDFVIRIVIIAVVLAAGGYMLFVHGPRGENAALKLGQNAPAQTSPAAAVTTDAATAKAAARATAPAPLKERVQAAAAAAHVHASVTGSQVTARGDFAALREFAERLTGQVTVTPAKQIRAQGPLLVLNGLQITSGTLTAAAAAR